MWILYPLAIMLILIPLVYLPRSLSSPSALGFEFLMMSIGSLLIVAINWSKIKKRIDERNEEKKKSIMRENQIKEHKAIWEEQKQKLEIFQKEVQDNLRFQKYKERVFYGYEFALLLKSCGASNADSLLEKLMQISIQMSGDKNNSDIGLLSPHNLTVPFPKGSSFYIGEYYQNDEYERSSLEWIVVDCSEDELLLVSKYALEYKKYNDDYQRKVDWSTCSLRRWLNNQFFQSAFTAEEKALIKNRKNATNPASRYNYSNYFTAGEYKIGDTPIETYDKVFLLSIEEFSKLSWNTQSLSETFHCQNGNPYKSSHSRAEKMWLRNNIAESYFALYVDDKKNILCQSNYDGSTVIRPAISISLTNFQQ